LNSRSAHDGKVQFNTREVVVAGDIAFEGGTYHIILKPRNDPKAAPFTVTNRHVHVLKRQADGSWKAWRMMTNSEVSVAAP
jgi:ketosteroid isomerase-like protein